MTTVATNATKASDDAKLQEDARLAYRAAADRGVAPTGKELGDQFGRSARWGRYQIDLAKKEEAGRTAPRAKVPVVVQPEPVTPRRRRPVGRGGKQRRPWHRPPTPTREASSAALKPPPPQDGLLVPWPFRRRGPRQSGLTSSWLAFLTGILVSVSANVLHARIDGGPASLAELVGAGFWPVALLLALEVLTRVPWPSAFWWGCARYVGIGVVAAGAFVLSYRHMAGLLTSWGEDSWNARVGPLVVDGLMLISATALLAIGKNRTSNEGKQQ